MLPVIDLHWKFSDSVRKTVSVDGRGGRTSSALYLHSVQSQRAAISFFGCNGWSRSVLVILKCAGANLNLYRVVRVSLRVCVHVCLLSSCDPSLSLSCPIYLAPTLCVCTRYVLYLYVVSVLYLYLWVYVLYLCVCGEYGLPPCRPTETMAILTVIYCVQHSTLRYPVVGFST